MNRATNLDALAAAMRSHAPWTLDELRRREASAFERAGIAA